MQNLETIQIILYVCLALMVLITILFISYNIKQTSIVKYENILFPTYLDSFVYSKEEKTKGKFVNKKRIPLKEKILNIFKKFNIDKKVERLYMRGGHYDKSLEDLLVRMLKFTLFGAVFGVAIGFIIGNYIVSAVIALVIIALPIIDLYGDIQDRQNEFRRDFPYFLQTLSFVLANGSNMSVAFNQVVNKQGDGVLKEVMLDVISTERVNGGDFTNAFATIVNKVDIDETREFVEIVQNNLEKGVPVAETFSSQSDTISRFISNKQKRKIKAMSTKILVPILLALCGIALLFI